MSVRDLLSGINIGSFWPHLAYLLARIVGIRVSGRNSSDNIRWVFCLIIHFNFMGFIETCRY